MSYCLGEWLRAVNVRPPDPPDPGEPDDGFDELNVKLIEPLICPRCTAPLKSDQCDYCDTRFANMPKRAPVRNHETMLFVNIPPVSITDIEQQFRDCARMREYLQD